MTDLKEYTFWFVTGSQHLYGPETLEKAEEHSRIISEALDKDPAMPCRIVFKQVVKTPDEIGKLCEEAGGDRNCAGLICWMHTFSPAKMWIAGLAALRKPFLHLHTQFNRDIPWDSIDMDFMNLNQSAHGDREFGFISSRLRIPRKVVAGYWEDAEVRRRISEWMRAAAGLVEGRRLKVARFGDNMRQVAVTEGDKVEAQIKFGWSVDGYGVGEIADLADGVSGAEVNRLVEEYEALYDFAPEARNEGVIRDSIRYQARLEIAFDAFLSEGGFGAFTTTFEDLHGLEQLPGLAVQRLMGKGYGFGAEGDWKTAAMVRLVKFMSPGFHGGTSFMEDYTYHLEPDNEMVLGAHMLEVCPTIAAGRPRIEVQPLGIGGRRDPARMVFDGHPGPAVNMSLIDMGGRFRLVVNEVDAIKPEKAMPRLPVARVLIRPRPSLQKSVEAWILAGGAHHTVFSFDVSAEQMSDWAEMADIECLLINGKTDFDYFKKEIKYNDAIR